MSKLVTIFGGSGFVGRYVARKLAQDGWRIRVAVRRPNEALFVRGYGAVGQVEPMACNIRDDASVRAAVRGANAVVNCVGILNSLGRNTFDAVQAEGAGRVARIAAEEGVAQLVHLSAIGADKTAKSDYSRTKGLGEEAVLAAFPSAVILRPSAIFGAEDRFFNKLAGMARFTPVVALAGAKTKFQPVYVGDVARAAAAGAEGAVVPGIYELGGPEVATLGDLTRQMLRVVRQRRLVLGLPFPVAGLIAGVLDLGQKLTGGLVENAILTRDQVRSLKHDNVVAPGARGLADMGIVPAAFEAVLPEYLWRFRPSGQYAAIKESAKTLRKA